MTFLAYSAPHGCSCVARRDCGCELSPFPFVKDARPPSLYLRQLAPATCLATCGGGLLGGGGGDGGGVVTWWSGIALRRGVRTELVQICPRVVYQCSPTRNKDVSALKLIRSIVDSLPCASLSVPPSWPFGQRSMQIYLGFLYQGKRNNCRYRLPLRRCRSSSIAARICKNGPIVPSSSAPCCGSPVRSSSARISSGPSRSPSMFCA